MGNSTSGLLRIKLDCDDRTPGEQDAQDPLYVAGQPVRGYVSVNLGAIEEKLPKRQELNFQLLLQIVGKERSKIVQGQISRRAQRILLFNETLLQHFTPDNIQEWTPEWHDFSFTFQIPNQMPSSLRCDATGRSYGELSYKVKASIEPMQTVRSSLLPTTNPSNEAPVRGLPSFSSLRTQAIICERSIIVKAAPVPPVIIPFMLEPKSFEVKTFGVKSQGRVTFGVSATDTHLGPSEILELAFACRNHSAVEIEMIYLKLVETVSWKVDGTKQPKTVERVLVSQEEVMSVPPKPSGTIWYERIIESDISEFEDSHAAIHQELQARVNLFRIQMPDGVDVHDTYAGPLVRCQHHVEFRVKTADHVDDPKVIVPLVLKQFVPLNDYHHIRNSTAQLDRSFSEIAVDFGTAMNANELAVDEQRYSDVSSSMQQLAPIQDHDDEEIADQEEISSEILCEPQNCTSERSMPSVDAFFRDPPKEEAAADGRRQSIAPVEVPLALMIAGGRVRPGLEGDISDNSGGSWISEGELSWTSLDRSSSTFTLPSLEKLLDEMLVSVDDLDIVCRKVEDPEWRPVLVHLSAEDFGLMIGHVNKEHDQPKVARVVASAMFADSIGFTCEHTVAAVQMAADWTRTTMVQQLLPFCSDLLEKRKLLVEILTQWELTVLHSDLDKAILERGGTWE